MPDGRITLGPEELRSLLAVIRRQFIWDSRMPVRLVSTASALGIYSAPPLNVLAFFAVPAVVSSPDGTPLDLVVTISSLVSELESASASSRPLELERLSLASVPVTSAMSVAHLPPSDGWQVPIAGVASDLTSLVAEAVAEFTARSAGLSETGQQVIADEIWERTAWAALPMRVLHASKRLGMLGNDSGRVSAASSGAWKRFTTQRGSVFMRRAGATTKARLRLIV